MEGLEGMLNGQSTKGDGIGSHGGEGFKLRARAEDNGGIPNPFHTILCHVPAKGLLNKSTPPPSTQLSCIPVYFFLSHIVILRSKLQLLVTANIVPSSLILFTLMMDEMLL
jgi:hypothetical protein